MEGRATLMEYQFVVPEQVSPSCLDDKHVRKERIVRDAVGCEQVVRNGNRCGTDQALDLGATTCASARKGQTGVGRAVRGS